MKNAVLTVESSKYEIKLDNFAGPLDLLCYLIEKDKMDIYQVNISEITDQYINYLNEMEKLNLEIASEFIVMASTLIYLKSKGLLPKQVEDEAEITEEELIRRIVEYKKYKEISKVLYEQFKQFSKRIYRLPEKVELPKQKLERNYDIQIIIDDYKKLIKRNEEKLNVNSKNIEKIAIIDTYTVSSKVKEMFKILTKKPKFVFNKVFSLKEKPKQEVVTAFSGLLELSRRSKVSTEQNELFSDIVVKKKKSTEEDENKSKV